MCKLSSENQSFLNKDFRTEEFTDIKRHRR